MQAAKRITLVNVDSKVFEYVGVDLGEELPSYAWPGGYPLYYLDKGNNCLCPACANENGEFDQPVVAADVNYEDTSLYCDHCSQQIEAAYTD